MSNEIATLALRLETERFNSGLSKARRMSDELGVSTENLTSKTESLTSSLKATGAALAALYAGNQVLGFFKNAMQDAAAYREDLARFNHVMRNVRAEADEMMKSLTSDQYGRTAQQAMQMTMNMTSMAKGMGMADSTALKLSGDFAKLSVDIGSFIAKNPEDVMSAFESALMGNTMALRSYGVHLTDASLKAAVLENAKKGLVFATDREAKAFAILSEGQRQQSDAIGDFAAESGNYRNQVANLVTGLNDLKKSIGDTFIEPATKVVTSINSVVGWLNSLDEETVKFISRLSAVAVGFGTAKMAVSALSPVWAILTGKTIANTAAVTAETTAVAANTAAWTANAVVRKGITGAGLAELAIPGTSTASVVGQGTINAVGAAPKASLLSRIGDITRISSLPGLFGLSGASTIGTGVAGAGAATALGAAGTAGLAAGVGYGSYKLTQLGGRATGLIGDTNYETGEGKLGFLEKQVTKFTEWMSGYKADGVDEFTKKVRERYTEQEKLWKEQAEAEEKRKQQLEKWRLHALQMQDFQDFQSKLQSDFNRSFMSPEELRKQLGTDLINSTMQRDTALNNDDFDKAKELEKERFRLLTEMRRLDDTIEKSKKESLEKELRAKENELQIRKSQLAELASLGDERFRFQLGMAEPSKRDSMVAERFESEYEKFIDGTADDPKASFSRIQGLASQLTQTMQNENKTPMKTVQNTTAAAIDSKSIQAAELRNRTWNTEVKRMDQNLQKIAGLNEKMLAAFDKMEQHLSNEPGTVSLSAN